MKNRKKLPKLKMNRNTKKLIRMVNKIIETTSIDDMNITDINLMQFAGAVLISIKKHLPSQQPIENQEMDHQHGSRDSRNK